MERSYRDYLHKPQNEGLFPRINLVGREAERARIKSRLDQFVEGERGLAIRIVGDAGMGKSCLMDVMAHEAKSVDLRIIMSTADPEGSKTPYYIWRLLLSRFSRIDPLEDPRGFYAWAAAMLEDEPELGKYLGLLNDVLPLHRKEGEQLAVLKEEGRQARLRQLLMQLVLGSCRDTPACIIIDDAQWLDSASLLLLKQFIAKKPDALILVAMRPVKHSAGKRAMSWWTWEQFIEIHLGPLSRQQTGKLLKQHLGQDALTADELDALYEQTGGNPFHCEEIAQIFREEATADSDKELLIFSEKPEVGELILKRIYWLKPDEMKLVKMASVFGHTFSSSQIREIYPEDFDSEWLDSLMVMLVRNNILRIHGTYMHPIFSFRHRLIRESAYSLLNDAEKQDFHYRVATWIEARKGHVLSAYYGQLVDHWHHAGDVRRSIDYMEKAGSHAYRSGAYHEAISCFERLLSINASMKVVDDVLRVSTWNIHLAEAQQSIGDPWESLRHLEEAVRTLGKPFPGKWGLIPVLAREAFIQAVCRMGLPLKKARDEMSQVRSLTLSRAFERIGEVSFYRCDPLRSLLSCLFQMNQAGKVPGSPEYVRAASVMSLVSMGFNIPFLYRHYEGLAELGTTQVRYEVGSKSAIAFSHFCRGMANVSFGNLDFAVKELESALDMFEELAEFRSCTDALAILEYAESLRGNFMRVASLVDWHDQLSIRMTGYGPELTWHRVWAGLTRAQNFCSLGRIGDAEDELETLKDASEAHRENLLYRIWYPSLRAMTLLGRKQYVLASDSIRPLFRIMRPQISFAFNMLEAYALPAEVELSRWEESGELPNRGQLAMGIRLLGAYSRQFPIARPRYLLALARRLVIEGHAVIARRRINTALQLAQSMGLKLDEAKAHLALAGSYPGGHQYRDQYAQTAREQFQQLGLAAGERRAQQMIKP